MDVQSARFIGAGLAVIALGGAGAGLGILFGHYLGAAVRNPAAAEKWFGRMMMTFALVEATGLFAFVVAKIILFV